MADNNDARIRRAAALEDKKRRLEDLKARRAATAAAGDGTASSGAGAGASTSAGPGGGGLDDYIDNLLSSSVPAPPQRSETETTGGSSEGTEKESSSTAEEVKKSEAATLTRTTSTETSSHPPTAAPKKLVESFAISTQTEEDDFPPLSVASSDSEDENDEGKDGAKLAGDDNQDEDHKSKGTQVMEFNLLTGEEKTERMQAAPLGQFMAKASKKVERLLEQQETNSLFAAAGWDISYAPDDTEDDTKDGEGENWEDAAVTKGLLQPGSHQRITLECPKWTQTRCITDMDWSSVHKDVIVASYHQPGSNAMKASTTVDDRENYGAHTNQAASKATPSSFLSAQYPMEAMHADGVALVWSLTMPNRPEFLFTSGASGPIGCIKFLPSSAASSGSSDQHQHLVVGGCDNGQLLLWDLRCGRLPVQKSTLSVVSNKGKNTNHAFRICDLQVAEGGSGLVSASADGRVNIWSLANLRDPAESYMVGGNVSSLAVAPESHSILCGDERGGLHSIVPPSSAEGSAAAGVSSSNNKRIVKSFDLTSPMDVASPTSPVEGSASVSNLPGHFGMVTSVATHRHATSGGANSSSSSRAMRRGFLRSVHGMALTTGVDWTTKLWAPAFREDAPLLSLTSSSYDYMCDVQWCPTNPSVFATASTNGMIDLWNLASSIEDPLSGSDGLNVHKIMGGGRASTTASSPPDGKTSGGAVNKLEWSLDGKRLAVAAGDQLHVMGLSENVYRAKGDEDARVMNHLTARGLLHLED